jgi:hypothetical protein
MKEKDFQVEFYISQDEIDSNICKIFIYNKSSEAIPNPEIQFALQSGQRAKSSEKLKITQDSTFVIGQLPDGEVIPANGKYEFSIEVIPKITKENFPKNFLIGFPCGAEGSNAGFTFKSEWKSLDSSEYRNCKVTLSNNLSITLFNPMITFETIKDQTVTSVIGVDIEAKGEKALSLDVHEITFAEFSGSAMDTEFPKGKREFTIGINKANSGKELKLPEHVWIGFEVAATALLC